MNKYIPAIFMLLLSAGCANEGKKEALHDIETGTPKYLIYGELIPFEEQVLSSLEEKLKIEIIRVNDDVIEISDPVKKWDSYNLTIEEKYLKERFNDLLSKEIENQLHQPKS
jgi:hypothetical protein